MTDYEEEETGKETACLPLWVKETAPAVFIQDVLAYLGKNNWDISIVFCNNASIRDLNRRFRDMDEPTDVLSFALGEMDGERFLPGDIVISLEMVEENAGYFGVPIEEELRRVLVHGILHLDGMDHYGHLARTSGSGAPEDGEIEPMLYVQEEILTALAAYEKKGSAWER
jgi:probable rRNA maturation factor